MDKNSIVDASGNTILNEDGMLVLKLKSESKGRTIGNIKGDTLHVLRSRTKHLLEANKFYGFNHFIISRAKQFDKVMIMDDEGAYLINNDDILEQGTFLWFNKQGFEKQIFVTLADLEKYKLKTSIF